MAKPKPIKVCLTNQGRDTETPWAEDLGPARGPSGSRKVRLINVPFMHAKPTWGDTIVVEPTSDGFPTWDRDGVPWPKIGSRIAVDGGRWAMIIDYVLHPDADDPDAAFAALATACAEQEVVCEGAWGPGEHKPGRAYLAVKNELSDTALMTALRGAELPCELIQIHPEPPKPTRATKRAAAKPATRALKTTTKKSPSKKPPAKKPASKRR